MEHSNGEDRVKKLINEIIESGRRSSGGEIRNALKNAPNSAFGIPLHPLDNIHVTRPGFHFVHFVSGVCLAYLDRIGYYSDAGSEYTTELEQQDLSEKVAYPLVSLLHRDRLRGLADWDEEGCVPKPNDCAALVWAVCGAMSYYDSHLTRRMSEDIGSLAISPEGLDTFRPHYEFGLEKFRQHAPGRGF